MTEAEPQTVHEPVRFIPSDDRLAPSNGTALCLSGGGYRAMLFHLGAVWRINDAGMLRSLERISSVSGGSITAAVLGKAWDSLGFAADGVAAGLLELVVEPLRELAAHTVDESAVAIGILTPGTVSDHVARAYDKHLFNGSTLQDLPASGPKFIINSTNLASGELWRFSRSYMGDWRIGLIENPHVSLAQAVAASSAFPPVLSPCGLDVRNETWKNVEGNDLTGSDFRSEIELTDGGVYDNLGLETAWKRCHTVLVSDAGGLMKPAAHPHDDWVLQSLRVTKVIDNQVRALRKRQVLDGYISKAREGVYWGIRSDIANFPAASALPCPVQATLRLAELPTRLQALESGEQQRLINWGYAVCDAGLRAHLRTDLPAPASFPYADAGVG
ncbi:MAG: patatin-like phospholipase family protein [Solirubrobacterales bacterium]|nr:patatin-like phospholipase family protein [Solirubrobacterales bacterium]